MNLVITQELDKKTKKPEPQLSGTIIICSKELIIISTSVYFWESITCSSLLLQYLQVYTSF